METILKKTPIFAKLCIIKRTDSMSNVINIYCDESCHLENDKSPVMVLGSVWVTHNKIKTITSELRAIKEKHGFSRNFEFKWTQISPAKIDFYLDIVKYFFENPCLHFRAIVAYKKKMYYDKYDFEEMYYIIYYYLLVNIISKESTYNIYIDIKSKKRGGIKSCELHRVLSRKMHDFSFSKIIKRLQIIDSKESELLQLADLFSGALAYLNRKLPTDSAKGKVVKSIGSISGTNLKINTLPSEKKFNVLYWKGKDNV